MLRRMTTGGALRPFALPAVCLVAVIVVGLGVVLLSQTVGGSDEPPAAPAFTLPPARDTTALDVKQRTGDTVTLIKQVGDSATQQEFVITPSLAVERLVPVKPADVEAGEWLTVIGVQDDVKNFTIHYVIVLPAGGSTLSDGVARSKGGFLGDEIARDQHDRPIVGGVVQQVQGVDVVLAGPLGTITVSLGREASTRLYRVTEATGADVKDGDRLAGVFEGTKSSSILVLPPDGK